MARLVWTFSKPVICVRTLTYTLCVLSVGPCVVRHLWSSSFGNIRLSFWPYTTSVNGWLKTQRCLWKTAAYLLSYTIFCIYFFCMFFFLAFIKYLPVYYVCFLRAWSCVENLTMSTLSYYTVHLVWSCMLRNNSCLKCLFCVLSKLY